MSTAPIEHDLLNKLIVEVETIAGTKGTVRLDQQAASSSGTTERFHLTLPERTKLGSRTVILACTFFLASSFLGGKKYSADISVTVSGSMHTEQAQVDASFNDKNEFVRKFSIAVQKELEEALAHANA